MADAKVQIDNPLAEPESAPQIAAEPAPPAEPAPVVAEVPSSGAEDKPAKAVAAG